MMDWRSAYMSFSSKNVLPIFFQSWYLDTLVGEKNWACTFEESYGEIQAIWIYFPKKKWGIPYCVIPTLLKYLGPIFDSNLEDDSKLAIAQKLFGSLPPHYSFTQQYLPELEEEFCREITQGFPFNKQISFKSRQTFYWDLTMDSEILLAAMDGNYRRAIKKHETDLQLADSGPKVTKNQVTSFVNLLEQSMGKLGNHHLKLETLVPLITKSEARNQGKLLLLYKGEELVTGAFIVWDDHKAYYLLAGNNKALKKIYPGVQMAYYTAKYLKHHTNVSQLDFVGSDIDSIARIWRKIGAKLVTYSYYASKSWWFGFGK